MGFVLATFDASVSTSRIVTALTSLNCIEVVPDWHGAKLRSMRAIAEKSGVEQDSAPFRSIHVDQARVGTVHGISFETVRGVVMTGQLREQEILLSNRKLTRLEIQQDSNFASIQRVLKQVDGSCRIEIG